MKWLLLLTLFGCATEYQPVPQETKTPEVIVVKDPAESPTETGVVLDVEPMPEPRVVFKAKSTLPYMVEVAKISNCIVNNEAFLKEVELYPKFTFTGKSSKEVADSIRNAKEVVLSTYRTKNPWSDAIAATFANDPVVYFNTRKNPRPMPEMVNTSCHEGLGHIQGHGHGDNFPNGKEDSVPYRLGTICEKYAKECQ